MSLKINDFSIINSGESISLNVETGVGYVITSMSLWTMDEFKDYSKAINLNSYLSSDENIEVFTVNAVDVGFEKFVDIMFIEIESDEPSSPSCTTCNQPSLGITYNLSPYYNCLMTSLLDIDATLCNNCNNKDSKQLVITLNMLLDSIPKALDVGYYTQAIDMVHKLQKLCAISICKSCPDIYCATCKNFIQLN